MTKKWKWTLGVGFVFVLVALMFHGAILQYMASPLIVDESADTCRHLAILQWYNTPDGDRCIDEAAAMIRDRPGREVLVVESAPMRLEGIGVLPSLETICRNEFKDRGVSPDSISSIRADGFDDAATARAVGAWLADHPQEELYVFCDRFRSAQLRSVMDRTLDSGQAARVRIHGSPHHLYDETNWWKSRSGFKGFGICWLRRLHSWLSDGNRSTPYSDADAYEDQAALPSVRADYAMILNGNENTRPFIAAALLRKGYARAALVTRTAVDSNNQYLPPTDEINRAVLLKRGVSPEAITILPGEARTTYDEARALAAFLEDRPQARVLVVTDDFHVRRSRWIFDAILGEGGERVFFVAAPPDRYQPDRWRQDEEGFIAITSEYLKLVFYLIRYGYFPYWVLACGILIIAARCVAKPQAAWMTR